MHIGTYGEDRWVWKRKLTPYAFSLHIAKLYFSEDWEAITEDHPQQQRTNAFDDAYFAERLACAEVDDAYFTKHENGQFFVA